MERRFALKNWSTGEWFTNDYECWWSRDLKDAALAATTESLERTIETAKQDFTEPLKNVEFLEVVTLYCR